MKPLHAFPILVAAALTGCKPESRFSGEFEELSSHGYISFAETIAAGINNGYAAPFDIAVDARAMLTSAFGGHDLTSDDLAAIAEVAPHGLALGDSICSWVGRGGHYQPIMLHVVEDRPAVLFRLIADGGALTYHDVIFGGTRKTGPKIVDVFLYSTGEYVTESMGRMLASGARSPLARVLDDGPAQKLSPVRIALDSMRALAGRDDAKGAIRYYHALPDDVRYDRLLLLARLEIARSAGHSEVEAVIRDMRTRMPDDVSLNLQLIDHHFVRGELDSAIAAIDRLDKAVEGDPYLGFMRAGIYLRKKDTAKAELWANKSVRGDKSLDHAYWMLIDLALARKDHRTTARLLSWLERYARYDVDRLGIDTSERYRAFVSSKEYDGYIEWRTPWREGMRSRGVLPEDEDDPEMELDVEPLIPLKPGA